MNEQDAGDEGCVVVVVVVLCSEIAVVPLDCSLAFYQIKCD